MPYKNPKCGIYIITTPNGSAYIGSSYKIENRWSEHKMNLRNGNHHSHRLQMAWNKHKENLIFDIICECERSQLNEMEQRYINLLNPVLNTTHYIKGERLK